jgi:hypothetical protein
MRRMLVVGSIVLAACGGGDGNGGGARGNSTVEVTGGISGTLDRASAAAASGPCSIPSPLGSIDVTLSAAVVGVASGVDLCSELQASREPANATIATVLIARTNVNGSAAPLVPGSYPVVAFDGSNPQVLVNLLDPSGNVQFAVVQASRNGAAAGAGQGCATAAESLASSGTVTIASVAAGGAIVGSLQATLADQGTVSGSFNAPLCGIQTSIAPTTCVPTLPPATSCQ